MAGTAPRSRRSERRCPRNTRRITRLAREILRQMATAGCLCLRGQHSTYVGRQIQKGCAPRTFRRLVVVISGGILPQWFRNAESLRVENRIRSRSMLPLLLAAAGFRTAALLTSTAAGFNNVFVHFDNAGGNLLDSIDDHGLHGLPRTGHPLARTASGRRRAASGRFFCLRPSLRGFSRRGLGTRRSVASFRRGWLAARGSFPCSS